jgi:hypothetical protein
MNIYSLKIFALTLLFIISAFAQVDAKIRSGTVVEKSRLSSIVVIGKVTSLKANTFRLDINEVLKGQVDGKEIEVNRLKPSMERPPVPYEIGDQILLFADRKKNSYYPFEDKDGPLKLGPGEVNRYSVLVRKILEFYAAEDPDAKTAALSQLLGTEDDLSQISGLEIFGREFRASPYLGKPSLPFMINLAKSRDSNVALSAIRGLASIGDKSAAPVLIELLESPDGLIARQALTSLKWITKADIEVDTDTPPQERAEGIKQWQKWWGENKDK